MPFSEKQIKTFRAIQHGWKPTAPGLKDLSPRKAGQMADEGVRTTDDAATALAKRMRGGK